MNRYRCVVSEVEIPTSELFGENPREKDINEKSESGCSSELVPLVQYVTCHTLGDQNELENTRRNEPCLDHSTKIQHSTHNRLLQGSHAILRVRRYQKIFLTSTVRCTSWTEASASICFPGLQQCSQTMCFLRRSAI
eukprot:scaffold4592_cov56-Attheya_sp.AAC.1